MLDWDDLKLFLAIARDRSLVGAARRLAVDHTTVARRLTSLEEAIGTRLFDRSPRGVVPTPAGLELVGHAERIEAEVDAATTGIAARDERVSGVVKLATPEAFGTFLVAPNAHRLYAQHPGIELELAPEARSFSLSKREADIAIGLRRAPRGRLVAQRLTDYRVGLYASRAYLERHGPIDDIGALGAHPLVWYIEEMIDIPEMLFLDQIAAGATSAFRSSSSAAQQMAVANGFGLGLLHVFAAEQDPRLVRVLAAEVEILRSYWLILHADQQRLPRVRAVIDFLRDIVAANKAAF
jgi:DNA-binding transcriptional LysR family regulator